MTLQAPAHLAQALAAAFAIVLAQTVTRAATARLAVTVTAHRPFEEAPGCWAAVARRITLRAAHHGDRSGTASPRRLAPHGRPHTVVPAMRWTAWSAVLLSLALAGAANAQAPAARGVPRIPPVQLVYTLGPGAERCPGVEVLQAAVARRMGGDPFDPAAARRLEVTIARRDGELRVAMRLLDEQGAPA